MPDEMERFTQRAQRVLSLAEEAAEQFQHNYIGTEHILLGLIREEGGVAGRVLRDLGLDQGRVGDLVERLTRTGQRSPNTRLDLSPGTKKVLELAVDEARRMGHHYIGTEHLLLGLVRQTEGIAIDVLKRLNVSPEEVRRQTRRALQDAPIQPNRPPEATRSEKPPQLGRPGEPQQPDVASSVWLSLLSFAAGQAAGMHHREVRPEHLLLAILICDAGRCGTLLRTAGLVAAQVVPLVEELTIEKGDGSIRPEVSPDLVNVLGQVVDESYRNGSLQSPSEHLLLGLLRSRESGAVRILKQFSIDPEALEKAIRENL